MTNFATNAKQGLRPWAKELSEGDILNSHQAAAVCETRLGDFGLALRFIHPWTDDKRQIVVRKAA